MLQLWEKYPHIKNDLENIKNIMKENINSGEKYIDEPILDLIDSGGKLLRPALTVVGSQFGDKKTEDIYHLAAVVELLHIATLVHDDIIDDSELRRGQQSIQFKYGKNNAVFIGDYLFTRCFMLLSNNYSMDDMKDLSKAISKICLGEIKQNTLKFKKNITIKDYLKIIAGKTATLFSLSLYIGAKESNADERLAKRLGKIGYELGMAFQITDDILEFTSSEHTIGKDIANDIKEGYYSLPIFYTFKENFELFTSGDLNILDIIQKVKSNDSIEQSKRLAEKYIKKVYMRIDQLPDIEAKEILKNISQQLLDREY